MKILQPTMEAFVTFCNENEEETQRDCSYIVSINSWPRLAHVLYTVAIKDELVLPLYITNPNECGEITQQLEGMSLENFTALLSYVTSLCRSYPGYRDGEKSVIHGVDGYWITENLYKTTMAFQESCPDGERADEAFRNMARLARSPLLKEFGFNEGEKIAPYFDNNNALGALIELSVMENRDMFTVAYNRLAKLDIAADKAARSRIVAEA